MLGRLPEAAARGLGSGPTAQLLSRLVLVERDRYRRVVEIEQSGEFPGQGSPTDRTILS